MNILILTHEYPPIGGGGANVCFFLSKEFAKAGNQVTIVTAQFGSQKALEITKENVQIYRVKCRRKNSDTSSLLEMFTYLFSAWKQADKLTAKWRYDICMVFFGIPSGPIALYLKKKYKLPYILRFGGGDIPGAQKRFKYMYKLLAPAVRRIWKHAARLIAISEGLRDRALRFENRYAVDIIENGVDNRFFTPGEKMDEKDCVRILFVSRLIEGKGLQYVIPSLKQVQAGVKEKCGRAIELVIVGDGPYKKQLEEIVRQTGNKDIVKFQGRQDKEQVRQHCQNADIFILPSLSEGMPNVVLEAMASGLPVLMTPCEGSKELVTDNGIISTLEDFPKNLVKLCADRELRCRMGQNSLRNVKNNFEWESIGRRYLALMQEITGEQGND